MQILHRAAQIERSAVDPEGRTVELSFSSETPIDMGFGVEILDHGSNAVDLSRLNAGGALLWNHDRDAVIGVVEKAWIAGRKGRARVRFGKSKLAEEVWNDVRDGIRGLVSVGYAVSEWVREAVKEGQEALRAVKWQPLEISIVSVPADPSVGVGRSISQPTNSSIRVSTELTSSVPTGDQVRAERKRVTEINGVADAIKRSGKDVSLQAREAIENGMDHEAFRIWCLENAWGNRAAVPRLSPVDDDHSGNRDFSRAAQNYSIVRAIARAAEGRLDGLEREMSDEYARQIGKKAEGFWIPPQVLTHKRSAQIAGTATLGGFMVGTESPESFIDVLRNKMFIRALGATILTGLQGNVAIPRRTGTTTAYWVPETGSSTQSNQTFGQMAMTPHCVTGYSEFSRQLLIQSSPDIESLVREDLAQVLALEQDRAAIAGTGANGEPLGILNTSDINATVTFGGTATWADVVEFESGIANDNADTGSLAYLTTPNVKGKWKTILKDPVAGAGYLWENGPEGFGVVNGYRAAATKQVPGDKVIFGNWKDLIIAIWGGLDMVVDPYTKAEQRLIRVLMNQNTDISVRHPESFNVSTDSGAQ